MNDREFELLLDRLYRQSTSRVDDAEFSQKLETKWSRRRWRRQLVLGGLSIAGAAMTCVWLVQTGAAVFFAELLNTLVSTTLEFPIIPIAIAGGLLLPRALRRWAGE